MGGKMSEEASQNKNIFLKAIVVALLLVVGVESYFLFFKKEKTVVEKISENVEQAIEQGRKIVQKHQNPFQDKNFVAEMRAMQRRIDRMFEQHFSHGFGAPLPHIEEEFFLYDFEIDLRETDELFIVSCDIPGLDKSQIKVSLQGNVLTIEGERSQESKYQDQDNAWISRERQFGSFSRSLALPAPVEAKSVKAEYKNGVLRISVKKLQPDKPQKTDIQVL